MHVKCREESCRAPMARVEFGAAERLLKCPKCGTQYVVTRKGAVVSAK